jgi:hypothetical protein
MDYGARFYSPALGRFISADSIVPQPGNPQNLNRFAYTVNNPLTHVDPTGHGVDCTNANCNGQMGGYLYGVAGSCLGAEQLQAASMNMSALQVQANIGYEGASASSQTGGLLGKLVGEAAKSVSEGVAKIGTTLTVACLESGFCERVFYGADDASSLESNGANTGRPVWGTLSRAAEYGIKGFRELSKELSKSGLEAHHLIEQRFARTLGLKAQDMLSVAVTEEEHQSFTNQWRNLIGYANSTRALRTDTATFDDIWQAAQKVYANYPKLLEAVRAQLGIK